MEEKPKASNNSHRRSIASPIFTELPLPQECPVDKQNPPQIHQTSLDFDDNTTAEHSPFSESCFTLNSASESSLGNVEVNNRAPPSLVNILEKIGQPSDLSTNNVVIHLRSTIANLLVDNDQLQEKIDDLNSKCKQLENEKSLHKENVSPESARLQMELNETRLREADLQMALEELKSRIDLTDKIVQSEPQLLEFFNSIIHDKIPPKSRSVSISTTSLQSKPLTNQDQLDLLRIQNGSFNRLDTIVDNSPMIHVPNEVSNDMSPLEKEIEKEIKKQGLESPQSDSGLSSTYSGSNPNSAGEWTSSQNIPKKPKVDTKVFETNDDSECYVLRRQKESNYNQKLIIRHAKSSSMFEPTLDQGYLNPMGDDSPFVKSIDFEVNDPEPLLNRRLSVNKQPQQNGTAISKWKMSLRESFSWMSKDSNGPVMSGSTYGKNVDYKFEALAAKHGEARALAKLRSTQVELKRIKAKCQQFEGHFSKQEENIHKLEQQIDEQTSRERKLKHEIRLLQRKIFQMEANHREFEVTQKIKEMELSSKLAEITFRITQSDTMNEQITAWNQIKASSMGDTPTPVRNSLPSVPYVKKEESPLIIGTLNKVRSSKSPSRDQLHILPPTTLEIRGAAGLACEKKDALGSMTVTSPSESLNQYKLDQNLIESILQK